MIQINAAARLRVMAASEAMSARIISKLKQAGFQAFRSGESGVVQIQQLNDAQCQKLCSKLQKLGFSPGGLYSDKHDEDTYPDSNGCYRLHWGNECEIAVDPEGYVYIL